MSSCGKDVERWAENLVKKVEENYVERSPKNNFKQKDVEK